jgi:hypothetical protein
MKKFHSLIFTIIFLFLSSYTICAETNDSDWFPFSFPEEMDENSPLNIGKLVLDPPAGKHGFLTVSGNSFIFEDGTPAKFWGTNLCFDACFPEKKEAEKMAARLAFFGFNAVRLHHMDYYFEPRGIFKDVSPVYKDPQKKRTGALSEKQLDKLDYLIYQLKERGIYINMNLLVSRHFTEADGVPHAKELGMAAKPVSMFDPHLIELQKKYAKDLLTHKNPYTGLTYAEDPAIAMIEITNENSVLTDWKINRLNPEKNSLKNCIPPYYANYLDMLWNNWLENKYTSLESVSLAWKGENNTATMYKSVPLPSLTNWQLEKHDGAEMVINPQKAGLSITTSKITNEGWHLQFKTHINVQKGENYLFKFTATAKETTPLGVVCQQKNNPWEIIGLSETLQINQELQSYEIRFKSTQDYNNAKLAFLLGYRKTSVTFYDISLSTFPTITVTQNEEKVSAQYARPKFKDLGFYTLQRQKDIRAFYIDLEKKYIDSMMIFLRKEIGIKYPITGIGGLNLDESIQTQINADFIDKHAYWDHPRFPDKQWDKHNFKITNKSIVNDSNLGFIKKLSAANRKVSFLSKPFTVTEWNHCYPNQYAYETPPLLAAYANKEKWGALFQFAYSHGWQDSKPIFNSIRNFFDCMPNAQQLSANAAASLIFIKGANISISSDYRTITSSIASTVTTDDSITITLHPSQYTYRLSTIKNRDSSWYRNGNFHWGKDVTIMKAKKNQ